MKSTTLHPMEVAKRAGTGGGGSSDLTERVEVLEEKITGLEEYSTEEVDTGKEWVDGKRIYRKTFVIDNPVIDSWTNLDDSFTADTVVNTIITLKSSLHKLVTNGCVSSNNNSRLVSYFANGKATYFIGSDFATNDTKVTITYEYTKLD